MHIRGAAVFTVAILAHSSSALADERNADLVAGAYFAHACADGAEHVAVYISPTQSIVEITAGATDGTFLWDRNRFEQLCALPELYVYHCHTTNDVLAQFPSGSETGASGDFAAAADMEFSCAKAAALYDHPPTSLHHALVTPRGEVTTFGFTAPTLGRIREAGMGFARLLEEGASWNDLERAQAEAQHLFGGLNTEYFARFIRFAMSTCPDGAIERCDRFSVERFAATWSPDDRLFVRVERQSARESEPMGVLSDASSREWLRALDVAIPALPSASGITELTPETLAGFVSDGKSIVSICSDTAKELRPCREAKERMIRLAAACPQVRLGFLDQDRDARARYAYPTAKDRSLLLFKTNPQSGLNEQFNLTTMGEPTPQLIALVLCDKPLLEVPARFLP